MVQDDRGELKLLLEYLFWEDVQNIKKAIKKYGVKFHITKGSQDSDSLENSLGRALERSLESGLNRLDAAKTRALGNITGLMSSVPKSAGGYLKGGRSININVKALAHLDGLKKKVENAQSEEEIGRIMDEIKDVYNFFFFE